MASTLVEDRRQLAAEVPGGLEAAAAPACVPPRWRGRGLEEDLGALAALLLGYLALAYLLLPAWWHHHERNAQIQEAPKVTRTAVGIPGDPINLALVGSEAELVRALLAAGWYPADPTTFRTGLRIARSVVLRRPYPTAPVSNLYLWGRRQDLAFERPVGKSPRQRHHVRFWRSPQPDSEGRPLWLGAATFDVSVGLSHRTGQVTHHIAADIDAERDRLIADLRQAGCLTEVSSRPGIGPTRTGRNGGGDRYFTDGNLAVGVLKVPAGQPAPEPDRRQGVNSRTGPLPEQQPPRS